MNTPVAFIIFNRPDTTARVFEVIRQAQPAQLFIIADGPRPDRPGEAERCIATRAIVEQIDWACSVQRLYAEDNMGCGRRVASGLTWVFEHVEEAIILEDDCLPDLSFFPYCATLLAHYREDARIMHINGNNYGVDQRALHPYSYTFCSFPQVWGWATWRRAWQFFDVNINQWPAFHDNGWIHTLPMHGHLLRRQVERWDSVYANNVDTWDYQWHFAVMSQHGLAISPRTNLISNIGFSPDATHTRDVHNTKANLPIATMKFPLYHPPLICPHPEVNRIYASAMLDHSFTRRLVRRMRRILALGNS